MMVQINGPENCPEGDTIMSLVAAGPAQPQRDQIDHNSNKDSCFKIDKGNIQI